VCEKCTSASQKIRKPTVMKSNFSYYCPFLFCFAQVEGVKQKARRRKKKEEKKGQR
jgi:hypothetical protein